VLLKFAKAPLAESAPKNIMRTSANTFAMTETFWRSFPSLRPMIFTSDRKSIMSTATVLTIEEGSSKKETKYSANMKEIAAITPVRTTSIPDQPYRKAAQPP